jgi:hypothetical protein
MQVNLLSHAIRRTIFVAQEQWQLLLWNPDKGSGLQSGVRVMSHGGAGINWDINRILLNKYIAGIRGIHFYWYRDVWPKSLENTIYTVKLCLGNEQNGEIASFVSHHITLHLGWDTNILRVTDGLTMMCVKTEKDTINNCRPIRAQKEMCDVLKLGSLLHSP